MSLKTKFSSACQHCGNSPHDSIKRGVRFLHSRVLDVSKYDGTSHQLFEVSAIRYGMVYFRPVYDYGERQELGNPHCCLIAEFPKYVKEFVHKAQP